MITSEEGEQHFLGFKNGSIALTMIAYIVFNQESAATNSTGLPAIYKKRLRRWHQQNPGKYYELAFSIWFLHVVAGFLVEDLKVVDNIYFNAEIRNTLIKLGVR